MSIDQRIAAVARRHGGHVSRAQLLALGLSADDITYRMRVGRLIRVHNGVYAVGRLPTTRRDQAAGALLACGPAAVLSHSSSAALWGIDKRWALPFELMTTVRRRPSGLRIHHARSLDQGQITEHLGLRVTTPARTVLDVAPRITRRRLIRVINDLRLEHRLTIEELHELVERHPRHPGARHLIPLINTDPGVTRSELEDAFRRFLQRYELPHAVCNTTIAGYEVDAYFPVERVIVELDGYDVHRTRGQFESDRARDARILAATGIPTIRMTHRQLHDRPGEVVANLRTILASRRPQAVPSGAGATAT